MQKYSFKPVVVTAVALLSAAASAQSSVTVYGRLDVGLSKQSGSSTQLASSSMMNYGTSRLGFQGREDLGNGVSAQFQFEERINAATGATQANTFARQAWVGLASNQWGSLKLGRTLTPSGNVATDVWDITGQAAYSATTLQFDAGEGRDSRNSSQIFYASPKLAGMQVQAAYVFKDNNGGNALYDLGVTYANGPLLLGLAYNDMQNGKHNAAAGASYDFGFMRLVGAYHRGHYGNRAVQGASFKGYNLGVSVPVGAFSLALDVARQQTLKDTDATLEARYRLSKRTFVYAAYLYNGDQFDGVYDLKTRNNFGLGIHHRF